MQRRRMYPKVSLQTFHKLAQPLPLMNELEEVIGRYRIVVKTSNFCRAQAGVIFAVGHSIHSTLGCSTYF